MKKLVLSIIMVLGAVLIPATAFAAATTVVSGVVTDKDGKPVVGATVSVVTGGLGCVLAVALAAFWGKSLLSYEGETSREIS